MRRPWGQSKWMGVHVPMYPPFLRSPSCVNMLVHLPQVLRVVGAGRGPLVRASLKAGRRAGRALRVYAVEKNPNAVVTLLNLVAAEG